MKNLIFKVIVILSVALTPIIKVEQNPKSMQNIKYSNFNKSNVKIIKPKFIEHITNQKFINNKKEKIKKDIDEMERRAALAEKEKKEKEKKEKEKYKNMYIPNHSSFKSYMPYTAITSKNSSQYKLQQKAYSDKNGLRKYGKYYLVAMGQYYGKIGDKFKVTLSSGQVFYAIIGDLKQFKHTRKGRGMIGADNKDMFEFIVDYSCLNKKIKKTGNVNVVLKGKVVKLQKER